MSTVIRPQQAVEYLRDIGIPMGMQTLCRGLQQRVFPFGDYIHNPDGRDVYLIYAQQLTEWAAARSQYAKKEDFADVQ